MNDKESGTSPTQAIEAEAALGAPQTNYGGNAPTFANVQPRQYFWQRNSFLAFIAYLWVLPALFFLVMPSYKDRTFVRFHSMQALLLIAFDIVVEFVVHIVPFLGSILGYIVALVVTVFWLIAMICAAFDKTYKIPVLGNIAADLAKTQGEQLL